MNEKPKQVFAIGDIIKKVGDLPEYLQFINNACLIEFIKQSYKDARKYHSFFLHKEDEKVKELWGIHDRYPYSTTYAYRISLPEQQPVRFVLNTSLFGSRLMLNLNVYSTTYTKG